MGMLGQIMAQKDPDSELAQRYMTDGAALMAQSGDRWIATMSLLGMAMNATARGEFDEARARFAAMRPLFQELGDRHRLNMVSSELAHIDRHEGNLEAAEAAYRETIVAWKRLGHRAAIAHQLESFAYIAQRRGRWSARRSALRGGRGPAGSHRHTYDGRRRRSNTQAEVARLRLGMDDAAFSSAWAEGRGLTMEQAISYAISNTLPLLVALRGPASHP